MGKPLKPRRWPKRHLATAAWTDGHTACRGSVVWAAAVRWRQNQRLLPYGSPSPFPGRKKFRCLRLPNVFSLIRCLYVCLRGALICLFSYVYYVCSMYLSAASWLVQSLQGAECSKWGRSRSRESLFETRLLFRLNTITYHGPFWRSWKLGQFGRSPSFTVISSYHLKARLSLGAFFFLFSFFLFFLNRI